MYLDHSPNVDDVRVAFTHCVVHLSLNHKRLIYNHNYTHKENFGLNMESTKQSLKRLKLENFEKGDRGHFIVVAIICHLRAFTVFF